MSKDPAFLWYPNDYMGGTMGMTFEERGAYVHLLMMQFNRGHMTTHMIGQEVGQLWDKLRDKFTQDDAGLWYNQRLELEVNRRQSFVKSRHNNILGNNQYTKKKKGIEGQEGGHMTSHMENENNNSNHKSRRDINIEFYSSEKLKTEDKNYHQFADYILGKNPINRPLDKILKMIDPVGAIRFNELLCIAAENGTSIIDKVNNLENSEKKYESFNLTLTNWLKNRFIKK